MSTCFEKGVYLFRATNEFGMKTENLYLHWHAIQRLKAPGIAAYNLQSNHPREESSRISFEARLCRRNGNEARFIGQYGRNLSAGTMKALPVSC